MSAPAGQIRCHGCDFEGVLQRRSVTLRYMLADGSSVDGHREFGWCRRCNGIRDIEQQFAVPQLQSELHAISSRRPRGFFGAIDRALGGNSNDDDAEVQRLNGLLRVAKVRKSSPRCLACGSDGTVPLQFDDSGNCVSLRHSCGGTLYRLPPDPNAPRFSYKPETIPLDVEGNRLDRTPDHSAEFLSYMTEKWEMKEGIARAFVTTYGRDMSKLHAQGLERLDNSVDLSAPENRLLAYQMPDPRDFALVGQAYRAYSDDISKGRHRGTPVEVAIWAILWNRSDLVQSIDPGLAKYIDENQDTVFKSLYDAAFQG